MLQMRIITDVNIIASESENLNFIVDATFDIIIDMSKRAYMK